MFNAVADYLIKQRAGERGSRAFTDWDKIKSICIVAEKNSSFDRETVENLLRKENKTAEFVLFHPDKVSNDGESFLSLNKKDMGILSIPKTETIAKLKSKNFDVLIDCNVSGTRVGKAIISSIPARCKVGHKQLSYASEFDLCLDIRGAFNFQGYLSEVINYLKMIKTNK